MFSLLAPPPGRNVPSQWLAPQLGMASILRSAHKRALSQTFLSQLEMVLFGRAVVGSASE